MSVFRLVSVDLTTIFIVRVKSKSTPLSSVCLSVTTNSLGSTYVVTSVVVTLIWTSLVVVTFIITVIVTGWTQTPNLNLEP